MPSDPTTVIDPWQDAPTHKRTLSHRLSYDHASGVIMLPEDTDWMEEEEEDSDVMDYGTENGLEQSIASLLSNEEGASGAGQSGGTGNGAGNGSGSAGGAQSVGLGPVGQRVSRYGTYFHHPERRTRLLSAPSIPGAFPAARP